MGEKLAPCIGEIGKTAPLNLIDHYQLEGAIKRVGRGVSVRNVLFANANG
jgi:hypothetical protein